jgi:hypothetical protein
MHSDCVFPASELITLIIGYILWLTFLMVYLAMHSISRLYSVYGKWMNVSMEHWWSDMDGKIEVLKEKPVPVPLCPPQIPYWLAWNQTSTFVMGNWWLTSWIVNDSLHFGVMNFVLVIETGMFPLAVCQYSSVSQNVNISLMFQLCSSCPIYHIQLFKPFSVMRAEYDSWPR